MFALRDALHHTDHAHNHASAGETSNYTMYKILEKSYEKGDDNQLSDDFW